MKPLAQIHEADNYLLYSLKKRVWAIFEEKLEALVSATRIIMNLPLKSETRTILQQYIDQEIDEIPNPIKEACIEIALALADGIDPEMEYRQLSKTTQGYSTLRQQKNTDMVEEYLAMGIPSLAAWKLLIPYLRLSYSVALERVS